MLSFQTLFGVFHTYVFQDLVDKRYILTLVHGKIDKPQQPLYVRLHSSCVTSETLRGCDCDCVQQLEGAFKLIAEKQHGILFYLLQEGRGAGYVGKARDRMLVQASFDQISTFQAYNVMGLKRDHRKYENIPEICHLLGIGDAQFVVLTNNPDKIQALTENGLRVLRAEPLEFEPSAFNAAYLSSKQNSGHLLRISSHVILRPKVALDPVLPFKPYGVPGVSRFIHCASYYLPMKPINGEILIDEEQFRQIFLHHPIEYYMNLLKPCVLSYQPLRANRYMMKIDIDNLKEYEQTRGEDPVCELLVIPYWFKVTQIYRALFVSFEFYI